MLLPFSRPSDGVAAGRNPHKRAIETRESSAGMEIADTQATDMTLNSDSMLIGTQPNGQELHTQTVIDSQEVLSELQRVRIYLHCELNKAHPYTTGRVATFPWKGK